MGNNFNLEIIAPDQKIFSSEVKEVIIPSFEGQMTILKEHIPLITFLRPGFIEIEKNSNENIKFFIEEGTVEFLDNKMLVLTTSAKNLKNFDKSEISEMIKATENSMAKRICQIKKYILFLTQCLKRYYSINNFNSSFNFL